MDGCIHCQRIVPIEEGGTIIISADGHKQLNRIKIIMENNNMKFQLRKMNVLMQYDYIEELQSLTNIFCDNLSHEDRTTMRGNIIQKKIFRK